MLISFFSLTLNAREKWTPQEAQTYYNSLGTLAGMNFMPSNCINQLEMWQDETFDEAMKVSDRELAWANELGFNTARVFLHDLVWKQDPEGFKKRIEKFLDIAHRHNIRIMFVFFDSCWWGSAKLGAQPAPRPHEHNSGWLQSPNKETLMNSSSWGYLEEYVKDVVSHFKNDKRVVFWDAYNEPSNPRDPLVEGAVIEKHKKILILLEKSFDWIRQANPSQAITSAVWQGGDYEKPIGGINGALQEIQINNSDILSFHSYKSIQSVEKIVANLTKLKGRPIVCSEYMARKKKSTFDPILGYFVKNNIASYCWGFVSGKTQTIYPWDSVMGKSKSKVYSEEPELWFHDVFRADGSPYDKKETDYIKSILK